MKILYHVNALYPDGISEPDWAALNVALSTHHAGHKVQIAVGGAEPRTGANLAAFGKRARGIPVLSLGQNGSDPESSATITVHPDAATAERPDVIHIMTPIGAIETLEHFRATPSIVTLTDSWFVCSRHGVPFAESGQEPVNGCNCARTSTLANDVRRVIEGAFAVTAPSRRVAEWCASAWAVRDIVHIPFGVRHDGLAIKTRQYAGDSGIVFGYVGALIPCRGVDLLIDAFRRLPAREARLSIAGFGPDMSYVRRMASLAQDDDRVVFSSGHDSTVIGEALNQVDVLVLPSLWDENAPAILHEALGREIPVIGSSVEGISELIVDGENGLLFEAGAANSLVASLRTVTDNPSMLNAFRGHIRRMVIPAVEQEAYAYDRLYRSRAGVSSFEPTRPTAFHVATSRRVNEDDDWRMRGERIETPLIESSDDDTGTGRRIEGLEQQRAYLVAHTLNLERALRSSRKQTAALEMRLRELEDNQSHSLQRMRELEHSERERDASHARRIQELEASERTWRASYLEIANSLTWRVMRSLLPPLWALHRALFKRSNRPSQE